MSAYTDDIKTKIENQPLISRIRLLASDVMYTVCQYAALDIVLYNKPMRRV